MAAVDREKLYEQVWTVPGARLAPQYGISDVALAKICKRHQIPRPPRGYWAKLAAGHNPKRTPLPKLQDSHASDIQIQGTVVPDEVVKRRASRRVANSRKPTVGADAPLAPHDLVVTAQAQLADAKPDHNGLLRTDPATAPEVSVSSACVSRCLTLLDSLVRKWESKGGTMRLAAGEDAGHTALAIDEDEVYVRIFEEVNEHKPLTDSTRLTGRLCAQLHGPHIGRRWADRKTQRLEKVMSTLVATAFDTLERVKSARLDAECVQRQQGRVRERRAAVRHAKDIEFRRRQKLMEYAIRWRDAELIRGYLAALRSAIDERTVRPIDEQHFREWFEWATGYADSIDPILQAQLPDGVPEGPTNVPVGELDLTMRGRALVIKLDIRNADELARVTKEQLREEYGYDGQELWEELTRVLEDLGYDVAKRRSFWY